MQNRPVIAAAMAVCALATVPARAANPLASATLMVTPTYETAGLRVATTGDDNANATGTVQFRAAGESSWRNAHPLVRIAPNRLASLLFQLRESTSYEVRVTMTDPDGAPSPVSTTFTTRTTPRSVALRTVYVTAASPGAAGAGTAANPYHSISGALKNSRPGDTILLLPGTYRERVVNVYASGTPEAPITIRPAGPGVYLRGDLPGPAEPHSTPLWRNEGDGTWSTPALGQSCYLAAGDTRLYHYKTRPELLAARAAGSAGWYQDAATFRVYLSLPGADSPDTMPIHIGQLQEAFLFLQSHDFILDGLDIGFFGAGYSHAVYTNQASNITIRNSRLHHATELVFMNDRCRNNLVENNEIFDDSIDKWGWFDVKGSDAEGAGVSVNLGSSGVVVRRNHIHNVNDGIVSVNGKTDADGDTDIYYNWVHDVQDDGIEPVVDNINVRAWCNTVRTAQNTFSVMAAGVGPVWAMYNVLTDFREAGMKLGAGATGKVQFYHNTMVTSRPNVDGITPWTPLNNVTWRNNILVATRYAIQDYTTTPAANASFDYDLLFTSAPGRFVKWGNTRYYGLSGFAAGTGQESHGLNAAPQFIDATRDDYRLAPGSPARHRAVVIPGVNDFLGTAPDLGAYQMGQ